MCSATFGDELWSTRGVGLSRVLNAIKVRSGNTVKLVFESPGDSKKKALMTSKAAKAAEDIAASMAKVDAAVQSIEERQAEISESFHKAEELLAEVTRVRDALTFNDDLRKRIERTVSRTRTLRGNVSK